MSETRIREFPASPFGDFLAYMSDVGASEWVWSWIEMTSRFGVCHMTATDILLARPVHSSTSEEDLLMFNDVDPEHEEYARTCALTERVDTWLILFASGSPSSFFNLCPYPLEQIAFHRNKGNRRLKLYNFNTLRKRFHGVKTPSTTEGGPSNYCVESRREREEASRAS